MRCSSIHSRLRVFQCRNASSWYNCANRPMTAPTTRGQDGASPPELQTVFKVGQQRTLHKPALVTGEFGAEHESARSNMLTPEANNRKEASRPNHEYMSVLEGRNTLL